MVKHATLDQLIPAGSHIASVPPTYRAQTEIKVTRTRILFVKEGDRWLVTNVYPLPPASSAKS